jgi:hypothetical protein
MAENGADARHLEHEPLQHRVSGRALARQKSRGLLRKVDQNRTRFEQRQRRGSVLRRIDRHRHLAGGIERGKTRVAVTPAYHVTTLEVIGSLQFLKHEHDLEHVGAAHTQQRQRGRFALPGSHAQAAARMRTGMPLMRGMPVILS